MSNVEIIPAIMSSSFEDLKDKMSSMKGIVNIVQIDVMDGKFVTNKSWPYIKTEDPEFTKIIKQEEGLPEWQDIEVEIDLMVKDIEVEASKWIASGASRIVIHCSSADENIIKRTIQESKDRGVEVVIAFELNKTIEDIIKIIKEENIEEIQLMGINKIGYQGEQFNPKVIEYITKIREEFKDIIISIDGGIKEDNIKDIIKAGVNRLIIGSAIFNTESPRDSYNHLKKLTSELY